MKLLIDADGCPSMEGATLTPILKGWSKDKKFQIETAQGERFLLRVADKTQYRQMRRDFADMRPVAKLGQAAQQPVALGKKGAWAYSVLTWIDGEDLTHVLPTLTKNEQYTMGLKAGALLKRIHSTAPAKPPEDSATIYRRKISEGIACYLPTGTSPDDSKIIVAYLEENLEVLGGRPRVFNHGDYNAGNLILRPDGTLGAIDFLAYYRDPWWELCAIPVGEEATPHYHTGMIHGYFGGEPPTAFFPALAYINAFDALTRVSPDDPLEIFEVGCRHIQNIFQWFDHFKSTVPTWYLGGICP